MSAPVTRDLLRGCTLTFVMHAKLTKGGVLLVHRVAEHPRLTREVHRPTRDADTTRVWLVDGAPCADLDEAVARLNAPPCDPRAPSAPAPGDPRQGDLFAEVQP